MLPELSFGDRIPLSNTVETAKRACAVICSSWEAGSLIQAASECRGFVKREFVWVTDIARLREIRGISGAVFLYLVKRYS